MDGFLGFSQTRYVSAGLMQACLRASSRISIFFPPPLSTLFFFFKLSTSGSDSRHADEHPLAAFDSEKARRSGKSRQSEARE